MKHTRRMYGTASRMARSPEKKDAARKGAIMGRRIEPRQTNEQSVVRGAWEAARRLYSDVTTRASLTLGVRIPAAVTDAADRLEEAAKRHRRTMLMASALAMLAGFALLTADTTALAQGSGSSNISFDEGADQIFSLIGTVALIVGVVVGIGSLAMKRVMAALGFGLGGALIWACCQRPEETLGAAANWVIEQFTRGTG